MSSPESERPVRWGILGTARIATKVGRSITRAAGAELVAVASRDGARAADWIRTHTQEPGSDPDDERFLPAGALTRAVDGYQRLLDDPTIDAVYIPLPPSLHAEWTIRAAERGKHVLCEKPLAASYSEARAMAAACQANNVQLMDGVMWLHHERTSAMQSILRSGRLGTLRRVTAAMSFHGTFLPTDDLRYRRELGGGALGDLGWYTVGVTLWATGELPERVYATGRYQNDVETSLSALLWFPGNVTASFDCGFDIARRKWFEVAGTEGSLVCDDFAHPWDVTKARFWLHGHDGKASQESFAGALQEVRMIERFGACVRAGRPDPVWPAMALSTQRVCDALDRSARAGEVVEVDRADERN